MSNFFDRISGPATRFAARTAVETVGASGVERTIYAALVAEAEAVAGWLGGSAGVARGDRVALLAGNDAHWVAAYLGILRLGAVAVPLDTAYAARQIEIILRDCGARVLFTTRRHQNAAEAAALAAGARCVLLHHSTSPGEYAGCTSSAPVAEVAPDDAAAILYTSGTTADPKGVVLTHANLHAERDGALRIINVAEEDAVLGVLPLFHALAQMANLLLPLSVGARVVFLESVNSTTLLAALAEREITAFACVPQFFYLIHQRVAGDIARRGAIARGLFRALLATNVALRDRAGWNPGRRIFARAHRALGPKMRWLITGGSRFDPVILRDLYGLGFTLLNAYGLTETSGGATIVRPGDRFTTSVGRPFPGVEIRIAAEPVATSDDGPADGEVLIRGAIVMREYFNRPDATAEAMDAGWLRTGDLGRLDADGRLYITGRKKEIIVLSSGKNLYPEEIEAHYRQSPFIKELCVLGLSRPGDPAAERLYAVVVPDRDVMRERGIVNVRELIRFELETLSVQLPPHKRILGYDISLEPLPRTTTGKLRRPEIERQALARTDTAAAERPLAPDERDWLARGDNAAHAAAIARRLHRDAVQPDANLELDLALDSMERVELLTMVEDRVGTRGVAEARAAIFTVRQLVDAVTAAPGTGRGPDRAAAERPWDAVLDEPPDAALVRNLARPKWIRAALIYAALQMAALGAKALLGFRVRGRARLPPRGPFIVTPNHQTFFDGFFLAAALPFRVFRELFFVGAAEFFETPIMAWGARAINIVPLDPDANLVSAMQAAAAGLGLGKALILFPEGERSIDGGVKTFRKGAAILAGRLDVPVVPVAIHGLYELWPRGRPFQWRRLFTRRAPVSLTFGAPLHIAPGDAAAGSAALQAAVSALFVEH